ncbi:MAG: C25 family cysteine peptidase [Candidatus Cloacimonadaceae bacterium]
MRQIIIASALLMLVMSLSGNSLQLTRPVNGELKISFNLPEFRTEREMNEGSEVSKLKVNAFSGDEWKENLSGLPQLESWIYIPEGYNAQVALKDYDTELYSDFECYKEDNPADNTSWLDISEPVSFRGNKILSFCVKPFQYDLNTRQLQTLKQAEITVRFTPDATYTIDERLQTPNTVKMLQSLSINRDDVRTGVTKPGSYVIIYNGTNITNLIQPYVDWKQEKGYEVHTLNTAINGNTTTAIKNYLQNAYDTWSNPPEFILIFGRGVNSTNYVPPYTEYYHYNTVGDYKYTQLDGTDLIPDAYIGRITFSNDTELTTAINRMLSYEKMQGLSTTNWLSKYFLLGDPSDSGISCVTTAQYIKGLIQDYNPDALITEAYSGSFPSQINAAINSGIGSYYYRGHGDFSGWSVTDISNLSNTGKYFFFSYITCFSGNFGSSSVSQAERLIRLGTPSVPKGAIGVIAATCETHTCLNNIMTGGIAYGLYVDGMTQGGPALVRGKLAFMANYPQNPANYINQYMQAINLLGDPGLDMWMKEPAEIVVTTPSELYSAGGNALMRVTLANGNPAEGVWVSLFKGSNELAVNGYTDENGWLVLPYGTMTTGSVKLTVTKPNHRTYQTSLVVNTNAPAVSLLPIAALQQCPSGATINFSVSVLNNSASALTGVSANLEALNNNVEVIQASTTFPEIQPGSSAASQTDFTIHISPDIPKGSALHFILHVTGLQQSFDLPFTCIENGPDFSIISVNFTNNLLNHGTNLLNVTMQNGGSTALTQLQAILESNHPLVDIPNPTQNLGPVGAGQLISLPTAYIIQVADSLAEGINVRFHLQLHNSNGFMQTLYFDKKVGLPTDDDFTGPDNYGYVCYGPGDEEYVPYNWMEIDPTQGGTGTIISLTDTDTEGSGAFQTITLPFQFRYYGKSYSQLTVCSNGFIMPGAQGSIEWMNWQIPGPMVPRPIIAPFWDDLLTDTSSRIVYKYDPVLNAEIIQWQNLKNKFMPSLRETFQVILYDPVHHSSPTGDSPILFQYKVFNNVDSGNYGVSYIDHGQYATIGIGDHTGTVGISYSFNNQYPPTAQVLGNQTTLYFATLPPYQTGLNLVILNTQITEIIGNGNGLPDASEQLSLAMTIKNLGLSSITESQVILTSSDPYVTILQEQSELPSLASDQVGTTDPVFIIQVAPNCPNHHIIDFNLNIEMRSTHLTWNMNCISMLWNLFVKQVCLLIPTTIFQSRENPGHCNTIFKTSR